MPERSPEKKVPNARQVGRGGRTRHPRRKPLISFQLPALASFGQNEVATAQQAASTAVRARAMGGASATGHATVVVTQNEAKMVLYYLYRVTIILF
jgi:hypothetical protein